MNKNEFFIIENENLAKKVVCSKFPEYDDLEIKPVKKQGHDNRTFRLGNKMLVKFPIEERYANRIKKENLWLPKLVPHLPLKIPNLLKIGESTKEYPFEWGVYDWIEGEDLSYKNINDINNIAENLANFLLNLRNIDSNNGPVAGSHNFYRGASLKNYDIETKKTFDFLKGKIEIDKIDEIWKEAINSEWQNNPVWVHGDIACGNLLVKNGKLEAIIDFSTLCVGDPACDFVIAWTFFKDKSREIFREKLEIDENTWNRARGWALWKALIIAADLTNPNNFESQRCWEIIDEIVKDYEENF